MSSFRRSFAAMNSLPSLVTGALWCAAALSAGYWALQLPSSPQALGAPVTVVVEGASAQATTRMQRALGATAVATADAPQLERLQLLGVIASTSGQGSALIAVDDKAPKAYLVGQAVGEGLVLQNLSPKGAQLGATLDGPRLQVLQLPADKTP
ncbi:type II secretion system protein N [Limnohabitans sp.]